MKKRGEKAFLPREIKFVVIHCSTCCNESSIKGCHFFITRHGLVRRLRGVGCRGSHLPGFDLHSVGLCYQGSYDGAQGCGHTPTFAQKDALLDVISILCKQYPDVCVLGHYGLTAKVGHVCPGFRVEREYAAWREQGKKKETGLFLSNRASLY